jgi:hypothetical protein
MAPNDSSPTQPEQRIKELLEEREEYIDQQEELRATRTETELKLLLSMIDERSIEDPFLVRKIRDAHVEEDSLPSTNTLYDEWRHIGYEIDRIYSYQQRVELSLAKLVLDTDEKVLVDLSEAIETMLSLRDESHEEYTE